MLLQMAGFLYFLWLNSAPYMYTVHPLCPFIHFQVLVIVNNAAMNMGLQIFLQDSDCDFVSFICIPRSRIDGSYSHSIFNFLRKLHNVFNSSYTNLHSHQWYTRIPFPPCLCQNYFLSFWWQLSYQMWDDISL